MVESYLNIIISTDIYGSVPEWVSGIVKGLVTLVDLLSSRGDTDHFSPLHSQESLFFWWHHWVLLKVGSNPPVVDT